ncbi:putative diguanylate cyclase YdaM [Sporomusa ovata DSM 2662]|uniref:FOG: GGDEF domain n=1 Tax=Sporomusa ovata TaxID=2378 RepID=A0A0U1KTF3_9FIRM|nr:GGDEF domain-containing protein [Sporomusa ovata]EQB27612.1 PAS domain S-box/diguanylate cyclase (GGDEF) domain-containing protein [Sporomusa ovata DSM 2662]CQR69964.1 FOG: GGDEF domain [Sporomusa ovata]
MNITRKRIVGLFEVGAIIISIASLLTDWPLWLLSNMVNWQSHCIRVVFTLFILTGYAGVVVLIILWQQNCSLTKKVQHWRQVGNELRFYSYYDAMSGAYNRNAFIRKAKSWNNAKSEMAIVSCDIDGLKLINDTLGHNMGDQLICATAEILTKTCNHAGQVYRIGGDEFLMLLPVKTLNMELDILIQNIRKHVAAYNQQQQLPLSISMGWALPDNKHTLTELIKIADYQMYQEKSLHREKVQKEWVQSLINNPIR